MANVLSSPRVSASVTAQYNDPTPSPINENVVLQSVFSNTPTVGTAAGNANKLYSANRTVTTGTPDVMSLSALPDPNGTSVAYLHFNTIMVVNNSTTTGQDLTIGGGTNAVFAAVPITIGPGGCFLFHNPLDDTVVTPSTGYQLQVTAAAGTAVPYTITILGRTA